MLKPKTWGPMRIAEAKGYAAQGWTAQEIADEMGLTRNQVIGANRDHRLGLLSKREAQKRAWARGKYPNRRRLPLAAE